MKLKQKTIFLIKHNDNNFFVSVVLEKLIIKLSLNTEKHQKMLYYYSNPTPTVNVQKKELVYVHTFVHPLL